MTTEQQRIEIAKYMGAKLCPIHLAYECCGNRLPDYTNDLNAMHEVAMNLRISSPLKYIHYTAEITAIVAKHNSDLEDKYSISAHDASAPHRARAFLKTIGKWID